MSDHEELREAVARALYQSSTMHRDDAIRHADLALAVIIPACQEVARTRHCSTVTLSDGPKGPFTIQDEATATCAQSIIAALSRFLPGASPDV